MVRTTPRCLVSHVSSLLGHTRDRLLPHLNSLVHPPYSLGVVFKDSQVAGACAAWLFCAAIMAYFAFMKPYLYSGGNYLSVVSYGSLLAAYTEALTKKLKYDGLYQEELSYRFGSALFAMWLLPYIVVFADVVNAPHFFV